jgi:hypothetical protein
MAKIVLASTFLLFVLCCRAQSYFIAGDLSKPITSRATASLEEVFNEFDLKVEYALIVASDGTAVLLSQRSFSQLQIIKRKSKFHSMSETLAPVTGLYDIAEISVSLINGENNPTQKRFSLRMREFEFLGESSANDYLVRKYKLIE